jgi:beta-galactosidase
MVPYAPGVLLAKGYKDGQAIAEEKVETTGPAASVKLTTDRSSIEANGEDLSIVTVSLLDAAGRIVPVADNLIEFKLSGPGRIIGVGNGDPSCHEPDQYVATQPSNEMALKNWRIKRGAKYPSAEESAEKFNDKGWDAVDVGRPEGPLKPGESAVFRSEFEVTPAMISAYAVNLAFGMIDDDGWVYVNGHKVGESHDWAAQPSFQVGQYLQEGANTIVVSVQNHAGSGGINKGVSLVTLEKPVSPAWQRSVFNGLAQVIVQADKIPGPLILTAHATGLASGTVNITTGASVPRPSVP